MRRIKKPSMQITKQTFRAINAFWIAVVGGMLLTTVSLLAHIGKDWRIDDNFHIVYSFMVNFLLIFLILVGNFRIIKSTITTSWKYTLAILYSFLITGLLSLVAGWMHRLIYDNIRLSDPDSLNLTRDIIVATFAIMVSLVLYSSTRRQQMRIDKEKLQNENLLVRYETLENQLDPHFLFNSLNTLSALIGNDDDKAQHYLRQLASTYRYIMQGKRVTSLADELDFVDSYCQMMQIRYGDNLKIEKQIDSRYLNFQIIPISLQLLIENALKHNVVSDRHPLTIILQTTPDSHFQVSNKIIPKQDSSSGTGLGLANLAKRYQLLCDKEITITDTDNTFTVQMPLLPPNFTPFPFQ